MKPVTKNFNTFKVGRINARQEVKKQQRIRNNLERSVAPKLNTSFRQFVKQTANQIKQLNEPNFDELKKSLNIKLELVMRNHYTKVFRTIFNNNEEKYYLGKKDNEAFVFGRSFDFERLVEIYMSSRVPYFSGMTEQASIEIQKVIFDGRADNLTLDQISRSITKKGYPIARRRANLIARTETHNAASFANNEYHKKVQQDLGTDMKKKWVSTSDLRTRSAHSSANGQEVNMDEDFIVGGVRMSYAGDPKGGAKNVINCRCIIIYAESSDEIIDSQEDRDNYGDVSPEELEFHKNADWNDGEANIRQAIRQTDALSAVNLQNKSGAFYRPSEHAITMSRKYGSAKTSVIWRHEYGHAIDGAKNNMKKVLASNIGDDVPLIMQRQFKVEKSRQISSTVASQMINDRKILLSSNRKNKKLFDNQKVDGTTVYKKAFTRKYGFDYLEIDGNGAYFRTASQKDVVKKIRENLKNTKGPFNTKLLDKLLGKSWADDIYKKYTPVSQLNSINANRFFNFMNGIENNYHISKDGFLGELWFLYKSQKKTRAFGEEILMFLDFAGSVTNNNIGMGHSLGYYRKGYKLIKGVTSLHTTEAFANYTSLLGGSNSKFWRELLEEFAPETVRRFDDLIDVVNTTP